MGLSKKTIIKQPQKRILKNSIKNRVNLETKKQSQATIKLKSKQERTKILQSFSPSHKKFYLDKQGKVNKEQIKKYRNKIPLKLLLSLPNSPQIIRETYFKKEKNSYTFDPPNEGRYENILNLKMAFCDMPEIRDGYINGKYVKRRGYASSFYYNQKGKNYHTGYGAIFKGSTFKPGTTLNKPELTKLEIKYPKATPLQKTKITKLSLKLFPNNSKQATKLILQEARNEGLNPINLALILKEGKENGIYPKGIIKITGNEPLTILIRWVATLLASREEEFKSCTEKGQLKQLTAGRYTKKFLQFTKTKKFSKTTKLKSNYYQRWLRPSKVSYHRPTFIESKAITKHSSPKLKYFKKLHQKHWLSRLQAGEWREKNTLKEHQGPFRGYFDIPSNFDPKQPNKKVFAGSHIFSEKSPEKLKGKITLDIHFHGIARSARGRFKNTYRSSENRIGVMPADAFPVGFKTKKDGTKRPNYLWRNMESLTSTQKRKALTSYFQNLILALEAKGDFKIDKTTITGHSGGGKMLQFIAELYPDGEIPLIINGKKRTLRIKGFFNADAHYYKNTELFTSYFSNLYQKNILQDSSLKKLIKTPKLLKEKINTICNQLLKKSLESLYQANINSSFKGDKLLNAAITTSTKISQIIIKKLLNKGFKELKEWKPPKYFSSATGHGASSQRRVQRWIKKINGKNGVQSHYLGEFSWKGHWNCSGKYIRKALDHFK